MLFELYIYKFQENEKKEIFSHLFFMDSITELKERTPFLNAQKEFNIKTKPQIQFLITTKENPVFNIGIEEKKVNSIKTNLLNLIIKKTEEQTLQNRS